MNILYGLDLIKYIYKYIYICLVYLENYLLVNGWLKSHFKWDSGIANFRTLVVSASKTSIPQCRPS